MMIIDFALALTVCISAIAFMLLVRIPRFNFIESVVLMALIIIICAGIKPIGLVMTSMTLMVMALGYLVLLFMTAKPVDAE